jgi:hypothetical protein
MLYASGGNLLSFAGYTPKKSMTQLRVNIKKASLVRDSFLVFWHKSASLNIGAPPSL